MRYGEYRRIIDLPGVTLRNVKVSRAEVRGDIVTRDRVSGLGTDEYAESAPTPFRVARVGLELDEKFVDNLDRAAGPAYSAEDDDAAMKGLASMLYTLFLIGLMLVGTLFLMRWLSGGGAGPLSFGRSRHKVYAQRDHKTTFADVAGIDEAVAELREVVDFLKRPAKYQALGGRIPKGVLLVGPPGTGKTLLAKAVAGEAEVPFFTLSGSDFVEMFVGVGAARVRDLFREAESKAPCIIFIDELDALGKSRGGAAVGGHDEREQTLNALLVEMDGFESNRGVIIMAATNRPETLDQALLRPGRFDRTVVVDRPDIDGREAILKVHARNIKLGEDVNLRQVAALTPGSAGADLANLVNEAALLAARREKAAVGMSEFNEAIERDTVGLERKSRIMKPDEKRRVAVHEAGHALVALSLPNSDPVHKVSIIPRGMAAGYVLSRPDEDRTMMTRSMLESHIRRMLGGTLAEELVFGDISTGATSDLNAATKIASSMVKEYGMSPLGRVYLSEGEGAAFLKAFGGGDGRDYSEATAREVDLEMRKIIETATADVRKILTERRRALDRLADRLVEVEVIEGANLKELLEEPGAPVVN
ncbi:MAG: ATP-dependent zinc metalloprotease FtsH [Gemmataceae bacterium]|nr:ATP-dependent zinc metalloprotease FtsH [Gemmataceae bacterium]